MIGEIAVVPQATGATREIVTAAVEEIAARALRYRVTPTGTCVEGELDDILDAVRAVDTRLEHDGVERALVELRLQREPHEETLEHQIAGIEEAAETILDPPGHDTAFGLSEQRLRERLEEELLRAMHVEGDKPTVHSIAHSVARILEEDHLRMAEQLEQAGISLEELERRS